MLCKISYVLSLTKYKATVTILDKFFKAKDKFLPSLSSFIFGETLGFFFWIVTNFYCIWAHPHTLNFIDQLPATLSPSILKSYPTFF